MKNLLFIPIFLVIGRLHASEAIGFYSKGSLLGAQSVFERGTPIQKLFVARKRLYTTDEMHNTLSIASEFIKNEFPDSEILQVGDLSERLGGEAIGHASHQNGLDADIVYLRRNKYVQSPDASNWDEDFISNSRPSKNFNTERNFLLFKFLVKNAAVPRIFVDASIKKLLCQFAKDNGEITHPETIATLRALRPQDLHRTHFHLRMNCPVNDHECVLQSAPQSGSGCDDLSILLEASAELHSC
ncbi:MAG: penicillin-insensitive murein endopeptidase [Bacteriovorax sp.]|nr:penicillin-insensitive murein endopeptidase [Bacteriovorax sp.]